MERRCMGCMELYEETLERCPHCGYVHGTPAKEAYHILPGSLLAGRYIVGQVLGFGGFGVTYIGYDQVCLLYTSSRTRRCRPILTASPGTPVRLNRSGLATTRCSMPWSGRTWS